MGQNQKVILLDIDYVLNDDNTKEKLEIVYDARGRRIGILHLNPETGIKLYDGIKPLYVKRLQQILDKTRADIVICSTWKDYFEVENIYWMLRAAGLDYPIEKFIGKTKTLRRFKEEEKKRREILAWVKENIETNYVVIDDVPNLNMPEGHKHRHIQTIKGLTISDTLKAIEVLNADS